MIKSLEYLLLKTRLNLLRLFSLKKDDYRTLWYEIMHGIERRDLKYVVHQLMLCSPQWPSGINNSQFQFPAGQANARWKINTTLVPFAARRVGHRLERDPRKWCTSGESAGSGSLDLSQYGTTPTGPEQSRFVTPSLTYLEFIDSGTVTTPASPI